MILIGFAQAAFGNTGMGQALTRVSYFKGNAPAQWSSSLPTYQMVSLGEVYDGIELILKAHGNNVEKLFVVQPGAAPETIRLKMDGAQKMVVNEVGELEVTTEMGVGGRWFRPSNTSSMTRSPSIGSNTGLFAGTQSGRVGRASRAVTFSFFGATTALFSKF